MKSFKVFLVICLALLFMGPSAVFAGRGDREVLNYGYVNHASTSYDKTISASPSYIFGVTVFASSANSYVLLYDTSTTPTGSASDVVAIEVGEATQYETKSVRFDPPIKMGTGIYADITSGAVVIHYR